MRLTNDGLEIWTRAGQSVRGPAGTSGKKKVVPAEGKIAIVQAKGVSDSLPEREKRAAAALARINAMQKAAQAAGGGDEGAAQL